jgi:hypothetical protein
MGKVGRFPVTKVEVRFQHQQGKVLMLSVSAFRKFAGKEGNPCFTQGFEAMLK